VPTIKVVTPLDNVGTFFPLQGSQYEYLPFDARVEFAIVSNGPSIVSSPTATVYSGTDVLQQRAPIDKEADKAIKYPDDFLLDDVAAAGERLSVEIEEVTGTALEQVTTVVKITPL